MEESISYIKILRKTAELINLFRKDEKVQVDSLVDLLKKSNKNAIEALKDLLINRDIEKKMRNDVLPYIKDNIDEKYRRGYSKNPVNLHYHLTFWLLKAYLQWHLEILGESGTIPQSVSSSAKPISYTPQSTTIEEISEDEAILRGILESYRDIINRYYTKLNVDVPKLDEETKKEISRYLNFKERLGGD